MSNGKTDIAMKTQVAIWKEYLKDKDVRQDDRKRLSIMYSLYPSLFGKRVREFHNLVRIKIKSGDKPTLADLAAHYKDLTGYLALKYPRALEKTSAENTLHAMIQEMSAFKAQRSVWVGRKNVDILIPGITGVAVAAPDKVRFTGIGIEVDGPSHSYTPKLFGDIEKDEMLSLVGVLPLRVRNDQLKAENIVNMLMQAWVMAMIDSRARRRLKMRIYLITIFLNWKMDRLGAVFGFNPDSATEKLAPYLTEVSI